MISLEQIQTLDEKVKKAIGTISDLRAENGTLKEKLNRYQGRIEELEQLIEDFKRDQGAIEQGILDAIDQLDHLEPPAASSKGEVQPSGTADASETDTSVTKEANPISEKPQVPPAMKGSSEEEESPDDQETNELDIF